jgi:hypothetical protein
LNLRNEVYSNMTVSDTTPSPISLPIPLCNPADLDSVFPPVHQCGRTVQFPSHSALKDQQGKTQNRELFHPEPVACRGSDVPAYQHYKDLEVGSPCLYDSRLLLLPSREAIAGRIDAGPAPLRRVFDTSSTTEYGSDLAPAAVATTGWIRADDGDTIPSPISHPTPLQDAAPRASAFLPVNPRGRSLRCSTHSATFTDIRGEPRTRDVLQPVADRESDSAASLGSDVPACPADSDLEVGFPCSGNSRLPPLPAREAIAGRIDAGPTAILRVFASSSTKGSRPDFVAEAANAGLRTDAGDRCPPAAGGAPPVCALTAARLPLDAPLQRLMLALQLPAVGVAGSSVGEYRSLPGFRAYPGRPGPLGGR